MYGWPWAMEISTGNLVKVNVKYVSALLVINLTQFIAPEFLYG